MERLAPCPLYVRPGNDAKRLKPRTGTDSVRTSHLTCSFTVMAPPAHTWTGQRPTSPCDQASLTKARSAAVLGGRRLPTTTSQGVADQAASGRQQPGVAPLCVIPEGAGPCQRRVLLGFWLPAGVRDWRSCFPDSCHVRGERPGGSRTGRSPAARGGAGGVLEVTGRSPDDLGGEGNGGQRLCGCSVVSGSSHVPGHPVRAVPLAAVIPSPVPGRGRGAWGGSASEGRSGGVNQDGARAARRRRGRHKGDLAPGRWPGEAVHQARSGRVTARCSGVRDRQRICPSRRP